jgi:hypothetical protein
MSMSLAQIPYRGHFVKEQMFSKFERTITNTRSNNRNLSRASMEKSNLTELRLMQVLSGCFEENLLKMNLSYTLV